MAVNGSSPRSSDVFADLVQDGASIGSPRGTAMTSGNPLFPKIGRFVVPATALLTFVSFWRASAIVLGDLGSSAFYVGGIAEGKVGKAAPWFILGIMLFS